jgi:hypothetical protein
VLGLNCTPGPAVDRVVFLQVVQGIPGFVFPGGVQSRATFKLSMQSCGILSIWSSHLNCLLFTSVAVEWHLHFIYRSSEDIFVANIFPVFSAGICCGILPTSVGHSG